MAVVVPPYMSMYVCVTLPLFSPPGLSSLAAVAGEDEEVDIGAISFVNRRGTKNTPHPEHEIFTFQSLRKR